MDPLVIGLLIASVVGTITSGILGFRANKASNRSNRDIANQTNQAQALLAEQQHAWNVQDWQMQNAYNDPSAQMQRFRDAGLNPSLIYGQMSNSPQISGTDMPQMHMAQVQPYTPPDFGTPFLSAAQSELALAQADKAKAEEDAIRQKLPEEINNLRSMVEERDQTIKQMQQDIKESAARIQSMSIEDQYKLAQKARIEWQSFNEDRLFQQQLKKDAAEIRRLDSESGINERRLWEDLQTWSLRFSGFQLDNLVKHATIGELNSSARANNAQACLYSSQILLTDEQIRNAQKDGELLGFQINAGRINDLLNQESIDTFKGKSGWILKERSRISNFLLRDVQKMTSMGSLLFRVGK